MFHICEANNTTLPFFLYPDEKPTSAAIIYIRLPFFNPLPFAAATFGRRPKKE